VPDTQKKVEGTNAAGSALAFVRICLRRLIASAAIAYPVVLVTVIAALRFVGERWWFTGATLYLPRIGFALPLPFVVAALLICRMHRLLLLQLVSAGLILFPLMGLVLPHPRFNRDSGQKMRVLSFNVDKDAAGLQTLLAAIDRYSPDLLLMQEIVVGTDSPLMAALRARYACVNATDQFVIASRNSLTSVHVPDKVSYGGRLHSPRYMRYVVPTASGDLIVYNVHPISPREGLYRIRGAGLRKEIASGRFFEGAAGPVVQANSGLRAAELEALRQSVRKDQGPVLVVGDTNLPGLSPILARLTDGYQDGFGEAGWGFGYTFPSKRPWMRIDRMFASSHVRFERFEVGCAGASDHLCIVADVIVH
jgi:vancomycin resistance protein VanJ